MPLRSSLPPLLACRLRPAARRAGGGSPPPTRSLQGYKFNIFYPDLIDKTKAPTYKVERDPTSPDGARVRPPRRPSP